MEIDKIYNKNCIEGLKELPDKCVDLIVTSPPYNAGINYDVYNDKVSQEEYLKMLEESGKELFRVLKDDGRICVNVGIVSKNNETEDYFFIPYELYNIYVKIGFIPREVIHWIKGKDENTFYRGNTAWGSWKSASNPHLRSLSEDILIFNKKYWGKQKRGESDLTTNEFKWWTKSVWFIVSDCETHEKGHPDVYPEELPKRLIKLYSYVGDVVLDPFCGIGTTCIVAKYYKRKYLGYELSPQYCKIATERLSQEILCFPETLLSQPSTEGSLISVKRESDDSPNSPHIDNKEREEANFS